MKKVIENKYTICIYVVFIILMIGVLSAKKDFHIDEYYSYGLSNSQNGLAMAVDWGIAYDQEAIDRLFINYLSMWEEETFDYKIVWENQSADVHPPLYYAVLHTIASFFPGKFSIWFAGSINILFAVLTLYILRKLANVMFQLPFLTNLVSIIFVLSAEVLSATSFFRMYVMAMFLVTLLTYYFVCLTEKQVVSWKSYIVLFILSVSSALTHYYCVVYLAFICTVYGVWLLINRQWKKIVFFVGTMIVSGISAILVFPAMLEHVFSGYRGVETMENFANSSLEDYWERITFFYEVFDKRLLGGMLTYVVISLVILMLFSLVKVVETETNIIKWLLVVIPTICYYLIIAKVTIDNGSERYMVPIYATAMVLFMGILYWGAKKLGEQSAVNICLCMIATIMVINGWKEARWPYLYINAQSDVVQMNDYANVDALAVYDQTFKVQMSYQELSKYNSVTFIIDFNSNWIADWECAQSTELVLMLIGVDESEVQNILALCPNMSNYEKVGNYGYCTTYYLY